MVVHGYGIAAVICILLMEAGSLGNLAGEGRLVQVEYPYIFLNRVRV